MRNYGVYEEGGAGKRLLFQFHVAGNTRSLYSVSGLELNRWYQVTCTYDGSMMRLYLNGALDNPGAASGTPLVSTDALTFGYAGYFTYAQASLADVRLYNRVLSATEIAGLTPQLKRRYTYGHDLISVTELPSTLNPQLSTHYYGYDGHGSVRFLTDSDSGAATDITDTYDYDAYGQLLDKTGSTVNNYRYTGEQWDADLGMYYLRARYLNPNTGRFWTMDSYEGSGEEPLSLHKYLYCQANPPNMVDPSGQNGDFITLVASMAVQMTTQTMNALRGAPAIVAARALPIVTGGTAFFQNYGSRALQYIGSLGSSAIRVLQTAFLRSGNIISQSQALRGQTWNSFRDLKAALNPLVNAGSTANPANIQWHHIVEQGLNLAKFGNNAINSLANVVPTPVAIHRAISGFYGSGPDWIRSLGSFPRVRDYVSSLPWDEQYRIGLEIWKYAMASNGQMSQQAVKQIILGQ